MRIGIMRNADGTLSAGPCRAKKPGTGNCPHGWHAGDMKEAQRFITNMTMHPGLLDAVDVNRDLDSMPDKLHDYLVARGIAEEDLPDGDAGVSIRSRWFHNDPEKAERYLQEAQDEGVLPKIRAVESVRASVAALVESGVKVSASADRVILKTPEQEARETDVWNVANGIPTKSIEGEAPVTLMVAEGKQEGLAASEMRRTYVEDKFLAMSQDRAEDLANAEYASLIGHVAAE